MTFRPSVCLKTLSPVYECMNLISITSGLKMDDSSFRICIAPRLGTTVCHPHHCTNCGDIVSKLGRHGLSCEKSKGRHSRHNQRNEIVRRSLISAGVPCVKGEPEGLSRSDGKQPDGMTLYHGGRASH